MNIILFYKDNINYSTALGAEIRSGRAGRVYSRRSPHFGSKIVDFGGFGQNPQKPRFWGVPRKSLNFDQNLGYKPELRALILTPKSKKSVFDKGGVGFWGFWGGPGDPPKPRF